MERSVEDGAIEERVIWNADIDPAVMVTFPPLVVDDVKGRVDALVSAATLDGKALAGTMDLPTLARMLLVALGEKDVDDVVERLFPDGEVADPPTLPERTAAEAAMVEALRELRDVLERKSGEAVGR